MTNNLLTVKHLTLAGIVLLFIILTGCADREPAAKGKLYIIGGGEKPEVIMNELADLSGIRAAGYMYVLPMASSLPDSAIIWAAQDFGVAGITKVTGYNFKKGETPPKSQLDSLKSAKLIFISGGDQSRFMDVVLNTPVSDAIREAYKNGAVISGTSAGAAVMSRQMITGNQLKHPDLESNFPTIEAENIEIREGLGLLENVIIDQHFVKRQRLNRLVAVSIEHPGKLCVGIDESTAIIVEGELATVTGVGQVIVLKNFNGKKKIHNGLLGVKGLEINVYLPGDKFSLK
jgi:cyanophycinase